MAAASRLGAVAQHLAAPTPTVKAAAAQLEPLPQAPGPKLFDDAQMQEFVREGYALLGMGGFMFAVFFRWSAEQPDADSDFFGEYDERRL